MLVVLLTGTVYAGDMPNGVVSTPPPPTTSVVQEPVVESQNLQTTESPVTETLLNLLQSVLALF
ncbi:MAG TPA: hypothetical protein VGN95_18465 [Pyrinomonadaceae bacterium]|jgi:hypothetical protein|nr:hypothetical protein [Pyrinomonadaceae bacterium]